ncbi:nuclear transport factor 2 family protein [Kribbella sp. NPDC026611]|uniref:nuclear transport factor 2 family protein n=1 Tax=Kribbella sp. NPDC026611 TaxID=3154911 RepID=UPI003401FDA6
MLTEQDRTDITDVINLHGHLTDAGELDRLDELFTPDVTLDVDDFGLGALHGLEAIRAAALALGAGNPVGHHVTNIVITPVSADSARVRSKGIGVQGDGRTGSVVYDDTVTRGADGWRISYRKISLRRTPLGAGTGPAAGGKTGAGEAGGGEADARAGAGAEEASHGKADARAGAGVEKTSTPSTGGGPRELLERFREVAIEQSVEGLRELYAVDAVQEFPFTRPGVPGRLEGREEIVRWAAEIWKLGGFRYERYRTIAIHETADPGTIVVEQEALGTSDAVGAFALPNLLVLTERDGQIARVRDYVNILAAAEALGRKL